MRPRASCFDSFGNSKEEDKFLPCNHDILHDNGDISTIGPANKRQLDRNIKPRYFCGDTSLHGCQYVPRFAKAGRLGWIHRLLWTIVSETKSRTTK